MLCQLSIRNILSLESIDIEFSSGLSVLTGETGAGKSILLDALGLALGWRAESGLLGRAGKTASVSAVFAVDAQSKEKIEQVLSPHDIAIEGDSLIMRRVIQSDGRSRGYINDMPVSITLMRRCAAHCVEVEGQFASQGLLNPHNHRLILDSVAQIADERVLLAEYYKAYAEKRDALRRAQDIIEREREQQAYHMACLDELDRLAPKEGEVTQLTEKRRLFRRRHALQEHIEGARKVLRGDGHKGGSVYHQCEKIQRHMHAVKDDMPGHADALVQSVDSICLELTELESALPTLDHLIDTEGESLESIEERLFALKGIARKHHIDGDMLCQFHQDLAQRVERVRREEDTLTQYEKDARHAWDIYERQSLLVREKRKEAAHILDASVVGELSSLKLEKARFETRIEELPRDEWREHGGENVTFAVSFNPGFDMAGVHKVASGGERSRMLLALRVVTSQASCPPTLIFDEVDSGVGGAVADAVGQRLSSLAHQRQILVVTHSPQVTAFGHDHYLIRKDTEDGRVVTRLESLNADDRREELARMLSGASITAEARAAATRLLEGQV
ncbi:MAG: DNA repair protein RecN [Alphaproteobacteria bacterium GM7ARS4]|nr:DNA repair protein RecN [Alphaproteobacteria bacterium GM7ARS4]